MLGKLKAQLLQRGLNLIKINIPSEEISLLIPKNHLWTFSEGDYYEANVVYWFKKILSSLEETSELVFYDIGANCGYYSLLAGKRQATIHAFEPSNDSLRITRHNILNNAILKTKVHQVALSNQNGSLVFHTYSSSGNDSLVKRDIPEGHELKYKKNYKVKAVKLDDLVLQKSLPLPSIVKIDIEGAELFALTGARRTLVKAGLPPIFIEYSAATSHDAGYKREDIRDFLIDMGYSLYGLSDDNKSTKLIKMSKKGRGEAHISNLLAISDSTLIVENR